MRAFIPSAAAVLAFGLTLGQTFGVAVAQPRGPYLQGGSHDAMTVVWRTDAATPSVVCYGDDPSALTRSATAPSGTQHEVRITGLSPDARQYYAVGGSACPPALDGDPNQYFETAPTPGSRDAFRLWLVGDSGTGGTAQGEVRDAMIAATSDRRPDLFLHVGDMAYTNGTTAEFDGRFFAMYESILENTVCWPALGNHEGQSADSGAQSGPYYEAYVLPTDGESGGMPSGTEAYYAFDYANVHFIVLDSYDTSRATSGAMAQWLELDLAATDQEWIVAFFHHPPYTKGSHDSDRETAHIEMRENLLPILEAHGVDAVFGGHSHIYERSYLVHGGYDTPTTADGHIVDMGDGRLDGDGPYLMTGLGSLHVTAGHGGTGVSRDAGLSRHPLMFFDEIANGSCIVDVDGGTLTLRNIRRDGVETDSVTLTKEEGLILISPTGGERLLAGTTEVVRWGSIGVAGDVQLEYSLDAGASWTTLVDRTENDGAHPWTLPRRVAAQARVRVRAVDGPSVAESRDFEIVGTAEVRAIGFGGVWEYHDQGVDQGTAWRTEYGGWSEGPAQLGYGDGDEATVLLDEDPNIPTVYFRQRVDLPGDVSSARLRVLLDDGAAVWINGTQVFAHKVADGTDFDAWASELGDETVEQSLDLSTDNPFVRGENIIAAVVKQVGSTSSDLSFDLELFVELTVALDPVSPDAGVADGGASDAGESPPTDGGEGSLDATPDGGTTGGDDGGCGCRITARRPARGPMVFMAAIGVAWLLRRRRTGRKSRRNALYRRSSGVRGDAARRIRSATARERPPSLGSATTATSNPRASTSRSAA